MLPSFIRPSLDAMHSQAMLSNLGTSSLGGGADQLGGGMGGPVLPPPPQRPARYRRMSADTSAVRQMAMMQAGLQAGAPQAAVPQVDAAADLVRRGLQERGREGLVV
jgi:hypothetical protein